ncbi:unannotated protein [freshwater metagenome]|uniref:Unannotated protein n=1 Tax=freshwater metagenome TaxID=449393 RepID=A0A6J7C3H5_9ZZZZ
MAGGLAFCYPAPRGDISDDLDHLVIGIDHQGGRGEPSDEGVAQCRPLSEQFGGLGGIRIRRAATPGDGGKPAGRAGPTTIDPVLGLQWVE